MTHLLDILPGIIWSGFLGLIAGNFSTSPIYRLPRKESLFARDPYCGDCNAPLKPRDLFPVLSWLSTRGHCRYCGAKVPGTYTATEALVCILFVLCYLKYGFSEQFILVAFGITAWVMLAAMLIIDSFFSDRTLIAAMVLGMLHRVLLEGTLYGFLGGAYAGLITGVIAWKFSGQKMSRNMAEFPPYLKLLTIAGIWLPAPYLAILLLLSLCAALGRKILKIRMELFIILLVILLSLWK